MPGSQSQPPSHSWSSTPGPAAPVPLLLSGARLTDGRTVDVRLDGGRIEAVGTAGSLATDGTRVCGTRIDLSGYLLLPAPAEPHAHPDTALSADGGGPVSYDPRDVQRRATEAALLQLGHGATALRAHVRVGDMAGLGALTAVLRTARALCGLAELTTVAMPRVLTGQAGADGLAVLRDAVKMGATAVGGCPDLDPDPTGYVEAVLEVAAEHGCPVDLHTDGTDPARLARFAAMAGGLRPGVTLGPCGGLARLPAEVAGRTADRLAAAGVTVVCLPQGGCGAADGRDAAPVRLLRSAGVRVAAGSGALRDVSNPVGRGDPLEAAYLLASCHGLAAGEAYSAVSGSARAALGLPEVRVEAGFPAELLAVRGDGLSEALSPAYSRVVVHGGRVVARTSAVREYCGSAVTTAELGLPRQGRGETP
ncbi:amidohydrolase family protein [Streptomyces capillispiralis]|uniref:Cytosine deaminase n=1 Tax=Streptomyces capillispiralis TaxID=68182 RepID=A0A561TFF1_9ACTN|nr:amidohydrolase family protein [Streptomyces capillispiralis]TWF85844.1 cytosine deaminase [Streptomyces capillispiralis]GHH89712.1 hydrolase [Streptomyces capillispiralis]